METSEADFGHFAPEVSPLWMSVQLHVPQPLDPAAVYHRQWAILVHVLSHHYSAESDLPYLRVNITIAVVIPFLLYYVCIEVMYVLKSYSTLAAYELSWG